MHKVLQLNTNRSIPVIRHHTEANWYCELIELVDNSSLLCPQRDRLHQATTRVQHVEVV